MRLVSVLFLIPSLLYGGCGGIKCGDVPPSKVTKVVYDHEIDSFYYKGNELLKMSHSVNGVLLDTVIVTGLGGKRVNKTIPGGGLDCPEPGSIEESYVITFNGKSKVITMKLIGEGKISVGSETGFNVSLDNQIFASRLSDISNINNLAYADSIVINGTTYYSTFKIQGVNQSNYLYFSYKTGLNAICIGNDVYQIM